jgi:uncharacterized membrane protein
MLGRRHYHHCNYASFLGGGGDVRVSWILNKVVVVRVVMGNTALRICSAIWFGFVSQGVTITYVVLLVESIAVGNMDREDYVQGMPAALRSITFCLPVCCLQIYRLQYTEL